MPKVVLDLSVSLDGYITGPNAGVGNPLGDDNDWLHAWMFSGGTDADKGVLDELYATSGPL